MSPEESISERIAFEFSQINKELKVIDKLNAIRKNNDLDEIQVRAAASSLHSAYNGIEKVIVLVLMDRGMPIPKGGAWHSDVLSVARMNRIISDSLQADLRDFMGFRHFYRHAYGFMLDTELLHPLLEKARTVISRLSKELEMGE